MADYFRKTERGRREVRERGANLSRAARNLLLILDPSKSLGAWVGMVQGATLADGVALLEAGLIESLAGPGGPETRPTSFEPTAPAGWMEPILPRPVANAALPSQPVPLTTGFAASAPSPPASLDLRTLPELSDRVPLDRPLDRHHTAPIDLPLNAPLTLPGTFSEFTPLPTGATVSTHQRRTAPGGALGYTELYDSLNSLLRENLGLIRGYRYTLRIERARDLAELEAVARDFITDVDRLRGASLARMVERALGLEGR